MEKFKLLINGMIALFLYFIRKPFINRENWIFGYNLGKNYSGSSKDFYEYVSKKGHTHCYFILRKNSNHHDQIENESILNWGSIRAFLVSFESEVIIVAHSPADVLPIYYRLIKLLKIKLVYNSHGIDGFKMWRSDNNLFEYKYYDIINAVGEFEKYTREKYLPVRENVVKVTGFSTFDTLINYEKKNKGSSVNKILLMMTWREYKSDLDKKILSFIHNEELLSFLKKNNLILDVVIHDFYASKFYEENDMERLNKKNINFIEAPIIQQIVPNYLFFITDYSSVAWLFLFLDKPVLFYQFDQQEYLDFNGGSLIDYNSTDFLSPVVFSEEKLINEMVSLFENGCKLEEKFKENRKQYITYFDNKNCYRLYREIKLVLNE